MHISDILTHLGENRQQYFNAVSPPIIQTSNFAFDTLDDFRAAICSEIDNHIYTRGNNPTVAILRKKIAALEKAEDALIFGSGTGAIAAAVIGNVKAGDHIICIDKPYSWTNALLTKFLARFGVTHTFVDGRNLNHIAAAIQPNTTLLYLESPNSLTFEIQDLKACASLAKQHGLLTVIDNSYASPIFQNPIEFGIDIVVHSGTKYLNGHSDVVLGVLCSTKAMVKKLFESEQMTLGSIIAPNDAAMVIRGLRTLDLRLRRCNDSTKKIVAFLENHPKVESVIYPLSPSFPQYALAKQQMKGAGGLFSIYLKTNDLKKAEAFFNHLKRFLLAVSWGGHESLVMPSVAFYNVPAKADAVVPFNLVRFYIGLEDADWLIEDLAQALEAI